jgi:carbon storage regulator CsrA
LNIRITVLSVGTNRVQLGIEAPNSIQITRPEISGLRSTHGITSEWRQVVEV